MRPICIVTHVDVADKAVGRDLHKLPTSSKIKRITAYVSSQLGLNPNLVCRTALPYHPDFCHAVTAHTRLTCAGRNPFTRRCARILEPSAVTVPAVSNPDQPIVHKLGTGTMSCFWCMC